MRSTTALAGAFLSALRLARADSELYLPDGTVGAFDQCDNEVDVNAWTSNGGAAARPEQTAFCASEYCNCPLGSTTTSAASCQLDPACIEECFQQVYGYSADCAVCFGKVPACSQNNGCAVAW